MKRKFVFFDIDGTLALREYIPFSTITTIQKLKENGHIVGIATGRQLASVSYYSKIFNIDYIVSDGGYGVTIKGETLHIDPLEKEIVESLCKELEQKHIPYALILDSVNNGLYATRKMLGGKDQMNFEGIDAKLVDKLDYMELPVYKIYMKIAKGQESMIECMDLTRINRYCNDGLVVEPEHKYRGVKEIVDYFQGNEEDIIYFGDGYNDLRIFDEVHTSVAMGNAIEELKQKATFVTKDIREDGIEYACKVLELI